MKALADFLPGNIKRPVMPQFGRKSAPQPQRRAQIPPRGRVPRVG